MKTLKTTITITLILTAIMSMLSCHDIPASNYQGAFMAWIESGILTDTPADPDEDLHAGREKSP